MKKETLLLISFIALKFILQFQLIDTVYELHRDEYLHLDQGKHLAWGYVSVPPFTAFISKIILWLGNGVFWVKFFPALFGGLTIVVLWRLIKELNGGLFALILGGLCILFSVLLRLNTLYQPNSADVFFWTLLYFMLFKFFRSNNNKWLYAAAIVFGIGMLNKYNIAFLLAGIFPALLFEKSRKVFTNKHLYLAFLLSFLIILPNIIWQFQNDFPVIHHMKLLADTQLVNVSRVDFLKEQLLYFIGAIVVIIVGFLALLFYKPFKPFRFFFWAFTITLLLFVYCRAKGYYAIGLYPFFIGFGAVRLEKLLEGRKKLVLRLALIGLPILLFIPIYKIGFPNKTPAEIMKNPAPYKELGLLRWEDGKNHELPQDYADMQGWKELAGEVDKAFLKINDPEHTVIICDNYGQAGAINYYSKIKGMNAVSMNADYVNWFPKITIKHAILVKEANDEDPNRSDEKPLFKSIYKYGEINNPYAREKGTSIYILQDAISDINSRVNEEIHEVTTSHIQ